MVRRRCIYGKAKHEAGRCGVLAPPWKSCALRRTVLSGGLPAILNDSKAMGSKPLKVEQYGIAKRLMKRSRRYGRLRRGSRRISNSNDGMFEDRTDGIGVEITGHASVSRS